MWFGFGVDCIKEIRGSGCRVLQPLEGTDKPYVSRSLGPAVSRLFEHEKLARPSDTGHYVVATRLFHYSWAKWDVMPGQRANQCWLFMVEPPWGMVTAHREPCNQWKGASRWGTVVKIERKKKKRGKGQRKASDAKTKRTTGNVEQKEEGWIKMLSKCQLSVSLWDSLAWDKDKP